MLIPFLMPLLLALCVGSLPLLALLIPSLRRQALVLPSLLTLGLTLGFLAGYSRMLPQWWQPMWPVDSTRWLPFGLPVMAILAIWLGLKTRPWRQTILICAPLGGLYAWLVLTPMRAQGWGLGWMFSLAAGFALILSLLSRSESDQAPLPGWFAPILAGLSQTASGVLFVLASSASLAQQAWIAALLQVPALVLLRRQDANPLPLKAINGYLLIALWLNAGLFTDIPLWQALSTLPLLLPPMLPTRLQLAERAGWWVLGAFLLLMGIVLVAWFSQPQALYLG
ncbi:MAG: hypothetical protein CVV27_05605 [Candidatus Melainabacteria bacterium HGW-Melainabacteria-1]|nr:MAG: hypothetical protein CVV27_05605 [Candidatus Melainabacteria bacterium HGW-Melainabacteria-1]